MKAMVINKISMLDSHGHREFTNCQVSYSLTNNLTIKNIFLKTIQ